MTPPQRLCRYRPPDHSVGEDASGAFLDASGGMLPGFNCTAQLAYKAIRHSRIGVQQCGEYEEPTRSFDLRRFYEAASWR